MTEVVAVPTGAVSALSAKASRASAATKVLNADDLMNWAEATFPQYFSPSSQPTVVRDGFVFRYYPVTENYLAVTNGATNDIYALGKTTEGKLIKVGALADFTCTVYPNDCASGLHYTEKVYALWTDKYPHAVTRTGVTRVKNMTPWNGLGKELFLCFIANHPLADGKILTLCKDLAELKWHLLYIDPTKEELREYSALPPSDLVYTVDPDSGIPAATLGSSWLDTTSAAVPGHPDWWQSVKVAEGYYFTPEKTLGASIMFQDSTGAVSTVAAVDPSGRGVTIHILHGYSN